jgi:hypothetical protein
MAAREAGNLTLAEALELLCLYAAGQDARFERAAVKWFGRFIEECSPSLLRAQFALAALPELRGGSEAAETMLTRASQSRCQLRASSLFLAGSSRAHPPDE